MLSSKDGFAGSFGMMKRTMLIKGVIACGIFAVAASAFAGPLTQEEKADNATSSPAVLTTAKLENSIGTHCALGEGVPQNYSLAAQWFQKAADHGYAKAQYNLANLYYSGQGVKQDYGLAAHWFEKAAAQQIAAAQYNLGNLYYLGLGVPQDFAKAAYWWQQAEAQGVTQARNNLAVLAKMHIQPSAENTVVTVAQEKR